MALLWPRHKGAVMSPTVKTVPQSTTVLKCIDVQESKNNSALYEIPFLTSLMLGFSLKNSEFSLLFGGFNLGFRKMQPFAKASKGAGPSYGNDSPTKTCNTRRVPAGISLLSPLGGSKVNVIMPAGRTWRTGSSSLKVKKRFSSFLLYKI